MWLAGWVHRDISAGNILWLKEPGKEGRGILSDLEYAKKPGVGSTHSDPKTVSYDIRLNCHQATICHRARHSSWHWRLWMVCHFIIRKD